MTGVPQKANFLFHNAFELAFYFQTLAHVLMDADTPRAAGHEVRDHVTEIHDFTSVWRCRETLILVLATTVSFATTAD